MQRTPPPTAFLGSNSRQQGAAAFGGSGSPIRAPTGGTDPRRRGSPTILDARALREQLRVALDSSMSRVSGVGATVAGGGSRTAGSRRVSTPYTAQRILRNNQVGSEESPANVSGMFRDNGDELGTNQGAEQVPQGTDGAGQNETEVQQLRRALREAEARASGVVQPNGESHTVHAPVSSNARCLNSRNDASVVDLVAQAALIDAIMQRLDQADNRINALQTQQQHATTPTSRPAVHVHADDDVNSSAEVLPGAGFDSNNFTAVGVNRSVNNTIPWSLSMNHQYELQIKGMITTEILPSGGLFKGSHPLNHITDCDRVHRFVKRATALTRQHFRISMTPAQEENWFGCNVWTALEGQLHVAIDNTTENGQLL